MKVYLYCNLTNDRFCIYPEKDWNKCKEYVHCKDLTEEERKFVKLMRLGVSAEIYPKESNVFIYEIEL